MTLIKTKHHATIGKRLGENENQSRRKRGNRTP